MNTQQQLDMFGKQCWGEEYGLEWNVLEREEKPHTTESALEYIEGYAGKLPESTVLIPVQVLYVPESNFFLMPLMKDDYESEGN